MGIELHSGIDVSGDLNGDFDVDIVDAVRIKKHLSSADITSMLSYSVTDGQVTVTGCKQGLCGAVNIPRFIENLPVTAIDDGAFKNNTEISSVLLPSSVEKIGNNAFEGCTALTGLALPGSVTYMGDRAFYGCGLKSIRLSERLSHIGSDSFGKCLSLNEFRIPASVNFIGDGAVSSCASLKNIRVSSQNTSYIVDDGVLFNADKTMLFCSPAGNEAETYYIPGCVKKIAAKAFAECNSIKHLVIPDNLSEIGVEAFSGCSSLVQINLPGELTVLNDGVFSGCSSLVYINLPEKLEKIKCYTFYGCEKLESVNIPLTVVSIEDGAFKNCTSILSIVIPYSVSEVGKNIFENCSKALVVKGYAGSAFAESAAKEDLTLDILECGHSVYTYIGAKSATCTEAGATGDVYCTVCGKKIRGSTIIPVSGHIKGVLNKKDATCESYGYTGDTGCVVCKTVFERGRYINPTGHYAADMNGYVAATCTEDGNTGNFTCERCGKQIVNTVIPKLNHSYVYISGIIYAD